MLKHLRIEADGDSYQEVEAALEAVTGMVVSPASGSFSYASSGNARVTTSWAQASALVPEDFEVPADGGEVIERRGGKFVGRRNIVFYPTAEERQAAEQAFPDDGEGPWIPRGAHLIERAAVALEELVDGKPYSNEAVSELAIELRDALKPRDVLAELEPVERQLTPEAMVRFTALAIHPYTTSIAFGPAKRGDGYEVDLGVMIPDPEAADDEPRGVGWQKTFHGETFSDAVEAAIAAVTSEVAGMTLGPVPHLFDAPPPGGDYFPSGDRP